MIHCNWGVSLEIAVIFAKCPALLVSSAANLYYYRRAVLKKLSSEFDEFLAGRSQFDSDHVVDFYAPTCCQSATFGQLFAFYCPLFFTEKIINNVAFHPRRNVYAARLMDLHNRSIALCERWCHRFTAD